jgi:micrococcal nuclease
MKKIIFLLAMGPCGLFAQTADTLKGTVRAVVDGNTIEVITPGKDMVRLKLYGINCPELGQPFGEEARRFLENLVLKKEVTVEIKGKDRWGNRLGSLVVNGNVDARRELLREGLAWTTEVNPDAEFEAMKEKARESGTGLWKEKDPVPPWKFRRQQTMTQIKSS